MENFDYRPDPQDAYSRDEEEAYHYAREAEQRQDEREDIALGWQTVFEEENAEEQRQDAAEEDRVNAYFNARHDWKAGEGPNPRGW